MLTPKEIAELENLAKAEKVVRKVLNEYLSYQEDPTKIFYLEIVETMKVLTGDLKNIREGNAADLKILGADKDDKLFDRIKGLLKDSATIFEGIQKGKNYIEPPDASQQKSNKVDMVAL